MRTDLILLLFAICPAQGAVETAEAPGVVEARGREVLAEGLWPSPKLLNLMLLRWAEEACVEYELDTEQRAKVRDATVERFETFLTENRPLIQPLVNEFIEMRVTLEPPSKERVQTWADRAIPVFEKARDQIRESQEEFRKILRPAQRARFEIDALQMSAGMAIAEQKLRQWKSGDVDRDVFWEPEPADRRARREERRRRRGEQQEKPDAEGPAKPVDQIVAELDRWDRYVADFVQTFRLDEGQRTAALSCLSELKERAIAHRDRRREDIARLEYRIEHNAAGDAPLEELKKQLGELYGPIDDMFRELQTRIEKLPTDQQRAAAERAKEQPPASDRPGEGPPVPTDDEPQPPG